jgi:beta-galactosidase
MKNIRLDEKWMFRRGFADSLGALNEVPGTEVDLPHDGMIGTPVSPDAPAKSDSGYFKGDTANYTKYVMIPEEWENECIGLKLDGVMMNATFEVNGCKVGNQHYGYAPCYVHLTDFAAFGKENRITINVNTSMHVNSRWYTGSGLYRGVILSHGPKVHIVNDGIFAYTKETDGEYAFLGVNVEVENSTQENRLAQVCVHISKDGEDEILANTKRVIRINKNAKETAFMTVNLKNPELWDAEDPNLYQIKVQVKNLGIYRTHFVADKNVTIDEETVLFGIRTITADSVRGLRINGKTVKLKGGCLHHDNGLLGAVSLYEAEARKVKKLKSLGFNAIRTAHNPPSAALVEACDRLGMYIFDEAFDAWGIAKRGGDYSQFFDNDHEKDLSAFIRRDRNHPSVIIWSTGNEIPERGGLNNGYSLATQLTEIIKKLDGTRPVSNGICSLWSGLDDEAARGQNQSQNASDGLIDTKWENVTEPFTNGLDIVGYNYMEDLYERDHELFPDRVMLGSENFAVQIGYRWPFVESLPYVIGDFTWTAWDYLGEAGIGKAVYVNEDDPAVKNPWSLMPIPGSPYPWRTANDADFDITGHMLPQGAYRSVVFGSSKTFLFSLRPEAYGKKEVMTLWGFPDVRPTWNYEGFEGKPVKLVIYSNADEVELFVNDKSLGRKNICKERPMPDSVCFETLYTPGKVEAVSYAGGKEISRDTLYTTGKAEHIKLLPEKTKMNADGHDLIYVGIELTDKDGKLVPDAEIKLHAELSGCGKLAGFGSADPITEDDYTDGETVSFRGRAMAIIRSGYSSGKVSLKVSSEGFEDVEVEFEAR